MTKLADGKSRLDLVKSGLTGGLPKRGRFIVSIDRLLEDPENERSRAEGRRRDRQHEVLGHSPEQAGGACESKSSTTWTT